MARVRIEYGSNKDWELQLGFIGALKSTIPEFTVDVTATAAGSRPVTPAGQVSGGIPTRLTSLDGPIYVAWGLNPTVTDSNSLRVEPGIPEVILTNPGDKLSFMQAPASTAGAGGGGSVSAQATAAAPTYTEAASSALSLDLAGNLRVKDAAALAALNSLLTAAQDTAPIGVFASGREYEFVAASDAGQAIGATGAVGDTLDALIIVPLTMSPGIVQIRDGTAGTWRTIFAGGAGSITSLQSWEAGLSLKSLAAGGWFVKTGADVQVFVPGDFT
jgi:hypothetical protein